MFSTLLIVSTLIGSHIVLATGESAPKVGVEQKDASAIDSERESRQFWLPPSSQPYANSFYYNRYWPSGQHPQSPYYPEYRRNQPADNENDEDSEFARQNLWGLSNFNSAINPVASLNDRFQPKPFIKNPNQQNILRRFDSCTDAAGKGGVCVPSMACSKYGGRPSGSCQQRGLVCCVNAVTKCGGQITLNNTFWESPPSVNPQSTCGLTVTLDTNLIEQKRPICQLRLDFKAFSIAQPGADLLCSEDSFVVGGATNKIPTICGDNIDQHMYVDVPSSTSDLILLFTFGKTNVVRTWNIQIGMISCSSNTLAPNGCLQYFSGSITGTIKSFNWKDTAPTTTRQLANQDYSICFRNELSGSAASTRICYTVCTANNGGKNFALTGAGAVAAVLAAGSSAGACTTDYLVIRDGFDPIGGAVSDRYCGNALNPTNNAAANLEVCSTIRDFQVLFRTDATEPVGDTVNAGFCLTFKQQVV